MKIITLIAALAITTLSGCVMATPYQADVVVGEPVVAIGFYDPSFGYWTGYGWDRHYYTRGHGGFGHSVYRGPRYAPRGRGGHSPAHGHRR